jgi:hypothetical protein
MKTTNNYTSLTRQELELALNTGLDDSEFPRPMPEVERPVTRDELLAHQRRIALNPAYQANGSRYQKA